jgi:hypothetical protein
MCHEEKTYYLYKYTFSVSGEMSVYMYQNLYLYGVLLVFFYLLCNVYLCVLYVLFFFPAILERLRFY